MLIRSQDKKRLTSNLNLVINEHPWKADSIIISNSEAGILGEYTTEEKALRVLDKICEFADEKHFESVVPEHCGRIDGIVFQMPQNYEV